MTEAKKTRKEPAKKSRGLIYVVDDEPMLLELALVILEPVGFTVKTFRDPELAVQEFNQSKPKPALVVTDYAMHSMNGIQLVERFRRIDPEMKILLVSGTVGEEIYQSAMCRPDKFLAKPYQAHQLIDAVQSLIEAN